MYVKTYLSQRKKKSSMTQADLLQGRIQMVQGKRFIAKESLISKKEKNELI